ncbi:MAG: hypothetical protein ACJ0BI_01390 [Paracoccaceae bacterium]
MNTEKWKSVLVPREIYQEIVSLSKNEGRTISGQLRVMFNEWKNSSNRVPEDSSVWTCK